MSPVKATRNLIVTFGTWKGVSLRSQQAGAKEIWFPLS